MEKTHLSKKPNFFYGYWIVAATFLCVFIMAGCGVYSFSLFVKPLQADLGWGRGGIMAAFTVFFTVVAMASPVIGRVVDRYGVPRVIASGAFITGIGFVLLSLMHDLWYFYLGYVVIGTGMTAIGLVPATAVVSNWFEKRRGTAIGIMSAGIGMGGFTMVSIIGGYLIPNFGWRTSYFALALLTWVLIIPLALLVIKTKPADMGLCPDGIEATEAVAMTKAPLLGAERLTLKMALATRAFWLITVSFLLSSFSHVGVMQSQVPYLDDIGFPVVTAVSALGGVGLASAIGKLGFGWLCDRIPAKYACCIGLGFQAVSIMVLMSVEPASPLVMIWLYAIMMGLGIGSWVPTMSVLTSTNFGLASYGAIFGVVNLAQSIGVATGPLMAGYMYDTMNTYHWAFIISLALYVITIPAVLAMRRPKSL